MCQGPPVGVVNIDAPETRVNVVPLFMERVPPAMSMIPSAKVNAFVTVCGVVVVTDVPPFDLFILR